MTVQDSFLLISDDKVLKRTAFLSGFGVVETRAECSVAGVPSVIVLDLALSQEAPLEVLRWLREQSRFEKIPVFALGTDGRVPEIEEAYTLGIQSCFLNTEGAEGFSKIAQGIRTWAAVAC